MAKKDDVVKVDVKMDPEIQAAIDAAKEAVTSEYQEALDKAATDLADANEKLDLSEQAYNAVVEGQLTLTTRIAELEKQIADHKPTEVIGNDELIDQIQAQQETIDELKAQLEKEVDKDTLARRAMDEAEANKPAMKYCNGLFCDMPAEDFEEGSKYSKTYKSQKANPVAAPAVARRPDQNRVAVPLK